MIRHYSSSFSKKKFVYLNFFFVLRKDFVFSFDVMTKKTTTKNRKNLIFSTKVKRTRKTFQIVLLTKTLKKEISKSIIIAKKETKRKTKKKILLRLLNEFYKSSKCLSKYQKQKQRQKIKHLIDDLTFLCSQLS